MQTYAVFLRGINVGGHKKVPMAVLKSTLEDAGFTNVKTVLNSGNILVDSNQSIAEVKAGVSRLIIDTFGFEVSVMVRLYRDLKILINAKPFDSISSDTKAFVTFLPTLVKSELPPAQSASFKVITNTGLELLGVLNLKTAGTLDYMKYLEGLYGKDITTRTWKTVQKLIHK